MQMRLHVHKHMVLETRQGQLSYSLATLTEYNVQTSHTYLCGMKQLNVDIPAQLWKKHRSSTVTLCPSRVISHLENYTASDLENRLLFLQQAKIYIVELPKQTKG